MDLQNINNDDIPDLISINSIQKKIPITLITGFLGAGKTTFLNNILKKNHGKKVAVIQNEFGERIGLEEAIIVTKNSSEIVEWIEFPNGCLCCTVKEEMLLSIENLVEKNPTIDAIFIETDGLADPEPLVRSFWIDLELDSPVFLDAIICIVDCIYFFKELDFVQHGKYHNEAYRQVAFSDVILLNKVDCVSDALVSGLDDILLELNPLARHYKTIKGKIPLQNVLNINAFDITHANYFDNMSITKKSINHNCCHDPNVKTITITTNGFTTLKKINKWLATLLWETTDIIIYRMKGVINVRDTLEKYNLQAVFKIFDVQPSTILWNQNELRTNKIVIIGKNLQLVPTDSFYNKCIISTNA